MKRCNSCHANKIFCRVQGRLITYISTNMHLSLCDAHKQNMFPFFFLFGMWPKSRIQRMLNVKNGAHDLLCFATAAINPIKILLLLGTTISEIANSVCDFHLNMNNRTNLKQKTQTSVEFALKRNLDPSTLKSKSQKLYSYASINSYPIVSVKSLMYRIKPVILTCELRK